MTKSEIVNWVEKEFGDFEKRLDRANKVTIKIYALHYKNVCLMALKQLVT